MPVPFSASARVFGTVSHPVLVETRVRSSSILTCRIPAFYNSTSDKCECNETTSYMLEGIECREKCTSLYSGVEACAFCHEHLEHLCCSCADENAVMTSNFKGCRCRTGFFGYDGKCVNRVLTDSFYAEVESEDFSAAGSGSNVGSGTVMKIIEVNSEIRNLSFDEVVVPDLMVIDN